MTKVITYGTFDMLHHGHVRLLERAKSLGDYLIVGVTSDDFDRVRGKINVKQPLVERLDAVRATGIADEVIVEEYVGQKIDDIKRFDVDIFTVGSDWVGYFDYLNEYCEVVYLERTRGISSSELRSKTRAIKLGLIGGADAYERAYLDKVIREAAFANGVEAGKVYYPIDSRQETESVDSGCGSEIREVLEDSDAVFIASHPKDHASQIELALSAGLHVICEEPIALSVEDAEELFQKADRLGLVLTGAIRTAYSTAFSRLMLLIKSGRIGRVISVDATSTSLRGFPGNPSDNLGSMMAWGPTALLPIFVLLGHDYNDLQAVSSFYNQEARLDSFSRLCLFYDESLGTATVAKGAKSEGDLVITGTDGYAYVPAPWWKTDYFELRFENPENNRRFFYQLDGEGIRNELVALAKAIEGDLSGLMVDREVSLAIARAMNQFASGIGVRILRQS